MGMVVRTNTPAANANRQLGINSTQVSKSLEKLSSGFKINRAADDASGLAISEKMKAQIKGLETASANSQDGISLIQTAEGGAQEIHDMLNRMTELATKSANGTIQDEVDREAIQREVDDLNSEITRISQSTNFNGINLLDGTLGGGKISANGSGFVGGNVAKFSPAEKTVAFSLAGFAAATGGKDTFTVDGQSLTIDWSQGDAKVLADSLIAASGATPSADLSRDYASKLTDLFNNAMQEQGLGGSVKITSDSTGDNLILASNNKTVGSEFSYAGTADANGQTTGVGAILFGSTAGESVISKAAQTYNGADMAAGDTFQMKINGRDVNVVLTDAIAKGETMEDIAAKLETDIRTAVDQYNTDMGLTAGTKDAASGLTGLTNADFTVGVKDGALSIKYSGDEEMAFSFSDIGEKTFAKDLGLVGGSSKSGGNGGLTLQIGDTGDTFNKVTVSVDDLSANGIGTAGLNVSNQTSANSAIQTIKSAINMVSTNRANLGSLQNRLEHTINNLDTTAENMTAANSRIRDTDMAKEMMNYTKTNVLVQSAQAMLAQANQQPQSILQLLQ